MEALGRQFGRYISTSVVNSAVQGPSAVAGGHAGDYINFE